MSTCISLEQATSQSAELIQSILDGAPRYSLNVDGLPVSRDAAMHTLSALPPNCSYAQKLGLGRNFYAMLENKMRQEFGANKIRLAVVDSNPVIPFWEKMGFKLTGETRPHEGRNRTGTTLILEKELT